MGIVLRISWDELMGWFVGFTDLLQVLYSLNLRPEEGKYLDTFQKFFERFHWKSGKTFFFNIQVSIYQLKGPSLNSSKRAILSFQEKRCPRYEHRKRTKSSHTQKRLFPFSRKNNFFYKIQTCHWICLEKCYYW